MVFTLAKFQLQNARNIDIAILTLVILGVETKMKPFICVNLPKEAKASTATVSVISIFTMKFRQSKLTLRHHILYDKIGIF